MGGSLVTSVHPPRSPRKREEAPLNFSLRDFFYQNQIAWDPAKVRRFVHPDDVNLVLSIKLYPSAREDMLGWHYNKDGCYTVKSGYWVATHQQNYVPPQPIPGDTNLKKRVWRIPLASKIKYFLWKGITNILPTRDVLVYRHMTRHSECLRCCQQGESLQHILFDCSYAQSVWRATNTPRRIYAGLTGTFEKQLQSLLDYNDTIRDNGNKNLPIWIFWRLWKASNVLYHQRKDISWRTTLELAISDAIEWQSVGQDHQSHHSSLSSRSHSTISWKKPPDGLLKCNYDGACKNNISCAGWVIRNHHGLFINAGYAKGFNPMEPLEAELQSLLMALKICWSYKLDNIMFEGDCQQIPTLLQGSSLNFNCFNWIRDIKFWSTKFSNIHFVWTKREGNVPEDQLAKLAMTSTQLFDNYWTVPNVISDSINRDYYA